MPWIAKVTVCTVFVVGIGAWVIHTVLEMKSAPAGAALTIAEHLKRTKTYSELIEFPLMVLWPLAVWLFVTSQDLGEYLVVFGLSVPPAIGWLFVKCHLRCPRCGTDFRKERTAKLGRWSGDTRGTETLWDACPRCGVSFSDSWP